MVREIQVLFSSMNSIIQFVDSNEKSPCHIDLIAGDVMLDARSIMEIFCLDVSGPIDVVIEGREEDIENIVALYRLVGVLYTGKRSKRVKKNETKKQQQTNSAAQKQC